MDNTLEKLIETIYPFIQQLDIGTRKGKWIVEVWNKQGQFLSSGSKDSLEEGLVCIGKKLKAIVEISV